MLAAMQATAPRRRRIQLEGTRYRLSGRGGALWIATPGAGGAVALGLAALHARLVVDVPYGGLLAPLLGPLLGVALGLSVLLLARVTRCRSVALAGGAGLATGLAALYAAWVAFEAQLLGADRVALLARPDRVLALAAGIHATGGTTWLGWTPAGAALWLCWALEAACIVLPAALVSVAGLSDHVFCESCGRWGRGLRLRLRLRAPAGAASLATLHDRGVGSLEPLEPVAEDDARFVRLDLRRCPTCRRAAAARAELVRRELSGGALRERSLGVSDRLAVSRATLLRLESLANA